MTHVAWNLRHLALLTIAISLVAGYVDLARFLPAVVGKQIAGRRFTSPATWVWIIPAAILLYDILQFRASSSSVFGPSMPVFSYFFDIDPLVGNWARMRAQMVVTAPFYAGVGYSLGALAWKHRLLPKLISLAKQVSPTSPAAPQSPSPPAPAPAPAAPPPPLPAETSSAPHPLHSISDTGDRTH
jgi:hypothetical protein